MQRYGTMPRTGRRPEKADRRASVLQRVDELLSGGYTMEHALQIVGVSETTYYRWRKKFWTLGADQISRITYLETENERLRRMISLMMSEKLKAIGSE